METNKIVLDAERFEELVATEKELILLKSILFSENSARLSYDRTGLYFEIDDKILKAIYPSERRILFERLKGENDV
jgi:hypothetical protein